MFVISSPAPDITLTSQTEDSLEIEVQPLTGFVSGVSVGVMHLDADGLLSRYTTLVYHRTGSYLSAARKLGLDRRTVKAKVDPEYLASLRGTAEPAS